MPETSAKRPRTDDEDGNSDAKRIKLLEKRHNDLIKRITPILDVAQTRQAAIFRGPKGTELLKSLINSRIGTLHMAKYSEIRNLVRSIERLVEDPDQIERALGMFRRIVVYIDVTPCKDVGNRGRKLLDEAILRTARSQWKRTEGEWNTVVYVETLRKHPLAPSYSSWNFLRNCLRERVARIVTMKAVGHKLPAELVLMISQHLVAHRPSCA